MDPETPSPHKALDSVDDSFNSTGSLRSTQGDSNLDSSNQQMGLLQCYQVRVIVTVSENNSLEFGC